MSFYSPTSFLNKPFKYLLGSLFIITLFTFTSQEAKAQWDYSVTGSVKKNKKKLEGAVVTLYKGSSIVQQITTPSNGKFAFKLDQEADYTLSVSKAGHITKKFVFSTRGIPEDRAKEPFGGQNMEVTIFEMPKDPHVVSQINSILSQPMAKFFYDDNQKEIDFDKVYSQSVRDALAKLQTVEDEANKKAEEDVKKNAEMEAAIASKYQAAIAKGDAAFGKKEYVIARAAYTEALDIKPGEVYPKGKIIEIEKLLADAAKNAGLEADYKAAIAKGDAAFAAKTYDVAKAGYNDAVKLKSAEKYPKDKLAEIDKLLADLSNKDKADKELKAKYDAAIAKADKALAGKTYDAAKAGYNEALGFKPAEAYPKTKLAEIDKILADLANKDKSDKELQAKYDVAIAKGDKALASKTYDAAKASYNEALALKAAEKYPKDKIAEIDKLLADIAAKDGAEKGKLAKEKELNDKYNAAIAKADAALKAKTYDAAKGSYNEALTLKAVEKYPKDRIAEIDKILADLAAKEGAEKGKLAKEKELNDKYNAAITKADAALKAKTYDAAKGSYNEALGIKASEKYPKDKIAEIDAILVKEIGAKALEEKYKAAIAKGDAALSKKDYTTAKSGYIDAIGLKPNEQYPKDKLAEIEKALADMANAAKGKDVDAKYQAVITKADKAFSAKTYDAAKTGYNEALGIKPTEQYPKDKLAEIEKLLGDAASEKDRLALETKYKAAIAKADAALKAKTYDAAKADYNEALGIKPNEKYPKDKLAEIEKLLVELASKDASAKVAKEKELNEKYNALIAKADASFIAKDYSSAKASYNDAIGFKPVEKYPKDKIAAIDALLANELNAKEIESKYKAAIANADAAFGTKDYVSAKTSYTEAVSLKAVEQYPKDQLAKIEKYIAEDAKNKSTQTRYNSAITKGDAALAAKEYANAIAAYKEAQGVKPEEPYPTNKISEVNRLLDDLARAKGKEQQYKDLIIKADNFFNVKDYKQARSTYQDALLAKATEKYPKDKIAEIDGLTKKKVPSTVGATTNKDDFRSELAKKYPEGITEESVTENNAKVLRRIVVKGNEGHLYIQKTTSFGPIYYFKDDVPITEKEFMQDTEVVNK